MGIERAARATELPVTFPCQGETLLGMVHKPAQTSRTGVLIVVGGPQYRVGSHRQFLLLARFLAERGVAVMRFDYRGMGDSSGHLKSFDEVNEDIAAAINTFYQHQPQLESVALWGLCDAASAALFYAHRDERVSRLILLNPWVRTESGEAQTLIKNYYGKRVLDKAFWKKLLKGRFNAAKSLKALVDNLKSAYKSKSQACAELALPDRMLAGLEAFNGEVSVILSGNDLTAGEFKNLVSHSERWKRALDAKGRIQELPEANHTFSSRAWRGTVEQWTLDVLNDRQGN